MNFVTLGFADVAAEDQAFVEQMGTSARISAALQKALLLSPRPASPEAFVKVFSAFMCADAQQLGDTATEPPEQPGGGEHKNDAGDARADTISVRVETMVRIPCSRTCPLSVL